MSEILSMLHRLEKQMTELTQEVAIIRQDRTAKDAYSISEAAAMTKRQGARPYSEWYLREGCRKGLIRGAYKPARQQGWRIPHDALRRILVDGMPVEQA
ncbi:MAG: hypothetical protein GY832_00415 [Chloroflexi bacterium]|nr:hypothetical protein [Chloroflexota bacterium]